MPSSIAKSSGISLTSDFYLRNFYKNNKQATKANVRKTYSSDEKAYEDSRALRRAAKKLDSSSFEEGENAEGLVAAVTAYVETYNNAVTSASGSTDHSVNRYAKQLKDLTAKYSDKLQNLGITVEEDGTLSINESYLSEQEPADLKEVFDPENDFMNQVMSYSKKIFNHVHTSLYEQLTGNGGMLNVSV